jgi:acetyltransferase-like isoleucine patch superfamily enzyme
MKAFLVKNRAPLSPFAKPAAQIRFRRCTVESRLRAQLADDGFEVVEQEGISFRNAPPDSIVVQDDILASRGFFRRFVASLPSRRRSYQCEIDTKYFPLFASRSASPCYRQLPLHYVGDEGRELTAHRMDPPAIHEVRQGMPPRMHTLADLCAFFLDYYALQIEYWFDIQTATSVYCREYLSDVMRPLHGIVPAWLRAKLASWYWLTERLNSIGRNSRIHRTAVLEGSVVGDNVEIGPFAYVRASVIGDGAVLTERSVIKGTYVGEGGFVMGGDVVNSYVGAETAILSPMLYNAVFGERGFLSGGSGFADFNVGGGTVAVKIDGKDVASNLRFLASAVGDDCFIGANLIFAPGRAIPDGTRILDHGLIQAVPTTGGAYVVSGTKLLQIPESFVGKGRS